MIYPVITECLFIPPSIVAPYDDIEKGDEISMSVAEIVKKEKSAFGTYFVIRESDGNHVYLYRYQLDGYMRQKGITELRQGDQLYYKRKE